MVILIPAASERLSVRLVEERFGPLCLAMGRPERIAYVLKPVLDAGWQIVETTPVERALLESHGLGIARHASCREKPLRLHRRPGHGSQDRDGLPMYQVQDRLARRTGRGADSRVSISSVILARPEASTPPRQP